MSADEAFLSAVINYTNSSTVHFKLSPAYILYAATRFVLHRHYSQGSPSSGNTHIVTSIANKMVAMARKVLQVSSGRFFSPSQNLGLLLSPVGSYKWTKALLMKCWRVPTQLWLCDASINNPEYPLLNTCPSQPVFNWTRWLSRDSRPSLGHLPSGWPISLSCWTSSNMTKTSARWLSRVSWTCPTWCTEHTGTAHTPVLVSSGPWRQCSVFFVQRWWFVCLAVMLAAHSSLFKMAATANQLQQTQKWLRLKELQAWAFQVLS